MGMHDAPQALARTLEPQQELVKLRLAEEEPPLRCRAHIPHRHPPQSAFIISEQNAARLLREDACAVSSDRPLDALGDHDPSTTKSCGPKSSCSARAHWSCTF